MGQKRIDPELIQQTAAITSRHREANGWSYNEFMDLTGNAVNVYNVERGIYTPSMGVLHRIYTSNDNPQVRAWAAECLALRGLPVPVQPTQPAA